MKNNNNNNIIIKILKLLNKGVITPSIVAAIIKPVTNVKNINRLEII